MDKSKVARFYGPRCTYTVDNWFASIATVIGKAKGDFWHLESYGTIDPKSTH